MNGGPAFPVTQVNPQKSLYMEEGILPGMIGKEGMSLRDYFAAKAMQGIIASPLHKLGEGRNDIAEAAYVMADEMLIEREKSGDKHGA